MDENEDTRPNITPRIAHRLLSVRACAAAWVGESDAPKLGSFGGVGRLLQRFARIDYDFGRRGFAISAADEADGLSVLARNRATAIEQEIAERCPQIAAKLSGLGGAADLQRLLALWASDDRGAGKNGASSATFVAVAPLPVEQKP